LSRRYGKTPYRYSPQHQAWRSAVLRGDENAANKARHDHETFIRREFSDRPIGG